MGACTQATCRRLCGDEAFSHSTIRALGHRACLRPWVARCCQSILARCLRRRRVPGRSKRPCTENSREQCKARNYEHDMTKWRAQHEEELNIAWKGICENYCANFRGILSCGLADGREMEARAIWRRRNTDGRKGSRPMAELRSAAKSGMRHEVHPSIPPRPRSTAIPARSSIPRRRRGKPKEAPIGRSVTSTCWVQRRAETVWQCAGDVTRGTAMKP